MTPRAWSVLRRRVAEFAFSSEAMGEPPMHARTVLLAILDRLARGEALPSQAAFARQLGKGYSTESLRVRLRELGGMVIWPPAGTTGSVPGQPIVSREAIELWLRGEWAPAAICGGDFRAEKPTTNTPLWSEKPTTTLAHARVNASSSSPSAVSQYSPASSPASMDSPQELARDATLMFSILRRLGFKLPMGLQDDIRTLWCGHYSVAEVEHGARAAARHGAFNLEYVESVMRSERARDGVVEFSGGAS